MRANYHAVTPHRRSHLPNHLRPSPVARNFFPSSNLTPVENILTGQSDQLQFNSIAMSIFTEDQEVPLDLSRRGTELPEVNASLLRSQRKLPCEICGKNFDRPSLLKRHLRTHTGEKPHGCSVCGKMFSTSSSLNTHARIHTGERPHVCPICGKRFTASSNLYYHRMTHYKEKPHKCNTCGRSFPTPGDLRAHSYSHTGDWPLRCPICARGFCKPGALHHHVQLHNGNRPYHCRCSKKCSVAVESRDHEKTHTAESTNQASYHQRKTIEDIDAENESRERLDDRSTSRMPGLMFSWIPWLPQLSSTLD